MIELWRILTAWCPKCTKEAKAIYEAQWKEKNGILHYGAVCQCNNVINKKTKERCGRKYFSWFEND